MIELKNTVKKFESFKALDGVDLTIEKGTAFGREKAGGTAGALRSRFQYDRSMVGDASPQLPRGTGHLEQPLSFRDRSRRGALRHFPLDLRRPAAPYSPLHGKFHARGEDLFRKVSEVQGIYGAGI